MVNEVKIPVTAEVKGVKDGLPEVVDAIAQTTKRLERFKWNPVDLKALARDLQKAEQMVQAFHKKLGNISVNTPGGAGGITPSFLPANVPGLPPMQPAPPGMRPAPGPGPSGGSSHRGGRGSRTHTPDIYDVGRNLMSGVGGGVAQIGGYGVRGAMAGGHSGGALGGGLGLLKGLGIGTLAFGAFKLGQGVSEGYDMAKDRAMTLDFLKRQLGDLGFSFERLKQMSEAAAAGLGLSSKEAAELAREFNRQSRGADRSVEGLAGSVRTSAGLARSYGLDPGAAVGVLGGLRNLDPKQNNRELALLIGETIERSGMSSRADEVMQAMLGFATSTQRMSLTSPNLGAYGGGYASLMRMPGMTSETAASMLGAANSSVMRMGAAGEAGQNFMLTALNRHGNLDPIQAMMLAEGGLFGTRRGVFGGDSAVSRFMGGMGGLGGGAGADVTNFDAIRQHLLSMGGDKGLQLDSARRFFGVSSLGQAAALMNMNGADAGGLSRALSRAGVPLDSLNETGIATLARIGSAGSKDQLSSVFADMSQRTGKGALTDVERSALQKAQGGDMETFRDTLLKVAAGKGQEETEASKMRESLKAIEDAQIRTGDKLIGPINTMRDALVAIATKLAPDSGFVRAQKNAQVSSMYEDKIRNFDAETPGLRANVPDGARGRFDELRTNARKNLIRQMQGELSVSPGILNQLSETDRMLGLAPGTSARQIAKESAFNPDAVSEKGAMGLAQVMPKTLAALEKRFGRKLNPYDPSDAVLIHRELMGENMRKFGDVEKALKAYNGGWDESRWGNPETATYANGILDGPTQLPASAAGGGRGLVNPATVAIEGTFTLNDRSGNPVAAPVRTNVSVPRGSGR